MTSELIPFGVLNWLNPIKLAYNCMSAGWPAQLTASAFNQLADNFWQNFDDKSLGVGLYAGHAAQPCFNSQRQHCIEN